MTQSGCLHLEPGALERALKACRRGDEHAARLLYAAVSPSMRAHARAILRDDILAEDAMQSAMCRMMTLSPLRISRVRDARAWLATLVRREALMLLRTNRRRLQREHRREFVARDTIGTVGSPVSHEDLTRALDSLPRRLREILVLKHVAGLTFDQIADATGINRNTAAGMHRRGVQQMREMLGRIDESQTTGRISVVAEGSEQHG